MIFIYLFIVLLISCEQLVDGQGEYACTTNYCMAFGNCPKFHCKGKNEITLSNSTDCGCCHRCVKVLEKGKECVLKITYNTPDTQCGPHLVCHPRSNSDSDSGKGVCTPISEVDLQVKRNGCEGKAYLLNKKLTESSTGEPIPECDEYGYYAPTYCKNGTLCHCVDRNGKRIFGTDTYDQKDNMNCLCSRQYEEVNSKLFRNYQIEPVNFMRCKSNGNYEAFQMVTNYTYCINTTSGEIRDKAFLKKYQDQLPCKNEKSDYSQETECIKKYKEETKKLEEKQDKYKMVIGYDIPRCDIDGSFKPVQCRNAHCYCVNKNGQKYKGTQVDRNGDLAQHQYCNCVRELELINSIPSHKWDKVTELFSQYICDENGNYLPVQCTESVCYCVDENGFQSSGPVPKANLDQSKNNLNCWEDRFKYYYSNEF